MNSSAHPADRPAADPLPADRPDSDRPDSDRPDSDPLPAALPDADGSNASALMAAGRVAALAVAVFLVYANSFDGVFVFDDNALVVDNPAIRQFDLWAILRTSGSRPLFNLTLAANYAWGGLEPFGYHVFNLGVHLLAVVGLFAVVRLTLRSPPLIARFGAQADWLAFVAALLWAVHPLNTQAVTYIVQRCEAMMAAAFLAVLWCLARAANSPRPWLWRCGAIVALVASVASKEVGLMAGPVAWLYGWAYFRPQAATARTPASWRRISFVAAAALLLAVAGLWWLRPVLLEDGSAGFGAIAVTPWQYFRSQPGVIVHYLRLVAWPHPLCLDYGWPVEHRWLEGIVLPGLFVTGLLITGAVLAVRRPPMGFPCLAFFLILAPTSSIVPIQDLAFEHRMYLPSAVLIATVVVGGYALLRRVFAAPTADLRGPAARLPGGAALAVSVAVIAAASALGWATIERNRAYHSAAGMWQDVLAKVLKRGRPAAHLPRLMANLGLELHKAGRTDEALEVFQEGLRAAPRSTAIRANYAQALIDLERFPEASEQLARILEVEPHSPRFVHQAALVSARAGRWDEAETMFRRAIATDPRNADFHVNLAQLHFDREEWHEALDELSVASGLYGPQDPRRQDIERRLIRTRARTHFAEGNAKRRSGDLEAARIEYEQTVALDPAFAPAHNNLGGLALTRSPADAVRHFADAVAQAPEYVEARFNLAQAMLQVGQVAAAVEQLQRIVADRPDFKPAQQTLRQIESLRRRRPPASSTPPAFGPPPAAPSDPYRRAEP